MSQNKDQYMVDSLTNQIAEKSFQVAKLESTVISQQERIQALEKEREELRQEQIDEMDKE